MWLGNVNYRIAGISIALLTSCHTTVNTTRFFNLRNQVILRFQCLNKPLPFSFLPFLHFFMLRRNYFQKKTMLASTRLSKNKILLVNNNCFYIHQSFICGKLQICFFYVFQKFFLLNQPQTSHQTRTTNFIQLRPKIQIPHIYSFRVKVRLLFQNSVYFFRAQCIKIFK